MNPDSDVPQPSPRDLLEERVTALILGELSETDAAEIRGIMATDPSLKTFYDQMKETIGLVSETLTQPAEADEADAAPDLSFQTNDAKPCKPPSSASRKKHSQSREKLRLRRRQRFVGRTSTSRF